MIAFPGEPPVRRRHLADISCTSRVIADFVLNFVAMATEVGRGEFVWCHSIARPRKPPIIHKDLADIAYLSRVIADFVTNFVAMEQGSSRGKFK